MRELNETEIKAVAGGSLRTALDTSMFGAAAVGGGTSGAYGGSSVTRLNGYEAAALIMGVVGFGALGGPVTAVTLMIGASTSGGLAAAQLLADLRRI